MTKTPSNGQSTQRSVARSITLSRGIETGQVYHGRRHKNRMRNSSSGNILLTIVAQMAPVPWGHYGFKTL